MQTHELRDYERYLSSPRNLDALQSLVRKSLSRKGEGMGNLVFAKHTIGPSQILDKTDEIGWVIRQVQSDMADWGMSSMICYGTLLGSVRNDAVIPHDDDVDMLYLDGSTTREEMLSNREALIERFAAEGYAVNTCPSENFHVRPPGARLHVGLFPTWTDDEGCHLMMERGRYRTVPPEVMLPVGERRFYGCEVAVPARPSEFLKERYGADWSESKPYHEWPIRIDDPLEWPARTRSPAAASERTQMIAWGQQVVRGENPPCNSLPLVELAVEKGYDAVEIDVRPASDGVFVLAHDDEIRGESGERIVVSKAGAAELAEFVVGTHDGEKVTIASLAEALPLLGDRRLHLGARIPPSGIASLRREIDATDFDPRRIIFCGYGDEYVRELGVSFPESVIMYKLAESHHAIDDFVLDDLVAKQVDGLMLHWPLHDDESLEPFMRRVKSRSLKVLFFVHPIGPTSHAAAYSAERAMRRMAELSVDYITTIGCGLEAFDEVVRPAADARAAAV